MKLTILIATVAVGLASVAAFAQMQHPNPNMPMQPPHRMAGIDLLTHGRPRLRDCKFFTINNVNFSHIPNARNSC